MKKAFKFSLSILSIIAITTSLKLQAQNQGLGWTCPFDINGDGRCVRYIDDNGQTLGYGCISGWDQSARCYCP